VVFSDNGNSIVTMFDVSSLGVRLLEDPTFVCNNKIDFTLDNGVANTSTQRLQEIHR